MQRYVSMKLGVEDMLTAPQHVLVVGNNTLLGAGIESLLSRDLDLSVIGIDFPGDDAALIKEIWRTCPDVVILNNASPLIRPTQLLAGLGDYPKLRLIVVNPENNMMEIYDKHQIVPTQRKDFTAVVRHNRARASLT